jgi:hypothetical protein
MMALAAVVRPFAALLAPHKDSPAQLAAWTTTAREADLPHVHSFTRGIDQGTDAVTAAITLDHHNGRTEGVNTKRSSSSGKCTDEKALLSFATASSSGKTTTESASEPFALQSLIAWSGGSVSRSVAFDPAVWDG